MTDYKTIADNGSESTAGGQHLWARGYWVASSGNVTDDVWKAYIENQKPNDPDDDFSVL